MKKLLFVLLLASASAFAQGPSTTKNVTLTWTDSTSTNVASYNIYLTTTPTAPCPATVTGFTVIGNVASPAATFTDSNRPTGSVLCYSVTALSTNGVESVISNIATVDLTRPLAPTGLTAVAK